MIAARQGSPLAIGHGRGEMYLGSDAIALAPFTDAITYLEEGDYAVLRRSGAEVFDRAGQAVTRPQIKSVASSLLVDKGNHRHFMAKEIHEQPEVISHTLANYIDMATGRVNIPDLGVDLAKISRVTISACGTAYYAGLVGKYWIERYARAAGRNRRGVRDARTARRRCRKAGSRSSFRSPARRPIRSRRCAMRGPTGSASAVSSTCARRRSRAKSDAVLPTLAGPEIGVASDQSVSPASLRRWPASRSRSAGRGRARRRRRSRNSSRR